MQNTDANFQLHPRLQADTITLGDWPLCRVLRMNDANYPWFILVPRVPGTNEIHQLHRDQRTTLWFESDTLSRWLVNEYKPDKLNLAALGNQVPQLHLHHVGRFTDDASWPAPIWGQCEPLPLDATQLRQLRERVTRLGDLATAGEHGNPPE